AAFSGFGAAFSILGFAIRSSSMRRPSLVRGARPGTHVPGVPARTTKKRGSRRRSLARRASTGGRSTIERCAHPLSTALPLYKLPTPRSIPPAAAQRQTQPRMESPQGGPPKGRGYAAPATASAAVLAGSMVMPGPIVVERLMLFTYCPLLDAGLDRTTALMSVVKFSSSACSEKDAFPKG